jgi:hypothetical protein
MTTQTKKTRKPKPPTIQIYFADDKKTLQEIERQAKRLNLSVSTYAKLSLKFGMPLVSKALDKIEAADAK